jgi:hypothetical protein
MSSRLLNFRRDPLSLATAETAPDCPIWSAAWPRSSVSFAQDQAPARRARDRGPEEDGFCFPARARGDARGLHRASWHPRRA